MTPTYATTPNHGDANGPAARSMRWIRRVAGRRIQRVSPSVSRIAAMSAISRCWTMCIEASCWPSRSTGEISATNRVAMPAANDASRHPPAARAPPSARDLRQRAT